MLSYIIIYRYYFIIIIVVNNIFQVIMSRYIINKSDLLYILLLYSILKYKRKVMRCIKL